jgi:hypothetical protein
VPRIEKYDHREGNGVQWRRLVFAPCDFLIDPGFWIRDTRVILLREDEEDDDDRVDRERLVLQLEALDDRAVSIGPYRVRLLRPQLYFDHGKPVAPWVVRRFRRCARPT